MINSRSLYELHPKVKLMVDHWLARCKSVGIDLLVHSTYRDNAYQETQYALGRTVRNPTGVRSNKPLGNIVTNARGGQSWHNYRCAVDVVIVQGKRLVWSDNDPADKALWLKVGELAEASGLEWSGRWKGSLRELGHVQYTAGYDIKMARALGVEKFLTHLDIPRPTTQPRLDV